MQVDDFDGFFEKLEPQCEGGIEYYARSEVMKLLGGRDIRKRVDRFSENQRKI
jgi:hypothetical protein